VKENKEEVEKTEKQEKEIMRVSEAGLSFIAKHEGFVPRVAPDPSSKANPTVGYGHKLGKGEVFEKKLDEKEAWALLEKDAEDKAAKYVRTHVKPALLQYQFDALTSFTFNVGAQHCTNLPY
jgi:lysozyme